MTKVRINPTGITYEITGELDGKTTEVHCLNRAKKMTMNVNIEVLSQGWYNWQQKGIVIQTALPMLSADEREFIMTGITPDEWDELWGEDEPEDETTNDGDTH